MDNLHFELDLEMTDFDHTSLLLSPIEPEMEEYKGFPMREESSNRGPTVVPENEFMGVIDSPSNDDFRDLVLKPEIKMQISVQKPSQAPKNTLKRKCLEIKEPKVKIVGSDIFFAEHKYVGPTKDNRPNYKNKQNWEWDLYPHGISRQNEKLRVQIKQKGVNPTYPLFLNTLEGLMQAAMYRDKESMRLWHAGILVRCPKFNFEHPDLKRPNKRSRKAAKKPLHSEVSLPFPEKSSSLSIKKQEGKSSPSIFCTDSNTMSLNELSDDILSAFSFANEKISWSPVDGLSSSGFPQTSSPGLWTKTSPLPDHLM
eukprot:647166-Amorphochlora_amoeboformis.AAC.3